MHYQATHFSNQFENNLWSIRRRLKEEKQNIILRQPAERFALLQHRGEKA